MISTQTKVFATSLTPLKTFCYSRRNFFYHFLLHQKSKKNLRWQLRIGFLPKIFYSALEVKDNLVLSTCNFHKLKFS